MNGETATVKKSNARVAILLVNGFDKSGQWGQYSWAEALEYPWIDLCLRQVERHSRGWDYEVVVFDNSHLKPHLNIMQRYPRVRVLPDSWVGRLGRLADRVPLGFVGRLLEQHHPRALDHLVRQVASEVDYIVTLDTDSFPVRDDWLDVLISNCEAGAVLTGVYRDEMAPTIRPFIHVSGFCTRPSDLRALAVSFDRRRGQDIGQNITETFVRQGRKIAPLSEATRSIFISSSAVSMEMSFTITGRQPEGKVLDIDRYRR